MKIRNIEDRFHYLPNRELGNYLFDGIPHASNLVLDIIGDEGIDFIHQKFQQLLLARKEMFGDAFVPYYGFAPHQRFYDLKERITIDVKAIITDTPSQSNDYTLSIYEDTSSGLTHKKTNKDRLRLVKSGILYHENDPSFPGS